jgi:tripartite-type tricarboxylate transporter receptor subunit TctC
MLVTTLTTTATAQSAAEFYKGKQVTLIIPAGSGGSYGRYGLLGKAALEKFMPGTTIVLQFMPGSGGVKATNYVANAAAKDGSVIVNITATIAQTQLFRPKKVHFDAVKIPYIGQYSPLPSLIAVWNDAPALTIEGAKKKVVVLGATGVGSQQYQIPTLLNALIGTKFKVISGYKGSRGIFHAIETKEVQGAVASTVSWATIKPGWMETKKVIPMFQLGAKAAKGYEGVPLIDDITTNLKHRQMLRAASTGAPMGRSMASVPGIPRDRLQMLRAAFKKGMHDPEMLAKAKKLKLPVNYNSGEELERRAREIMKTPKSVVNEVKKILNIKG